MSTKWMDLNEFREEGYLQEVNRQFFHPLGLALAISVDDDGQVTGLAGIIDGRDDPRGMWYGPGEMSVAKAKYVEKLQQQAEKRREDEFGWNVQIPWDYAYTLEDVFFGGMPDELNGEYILDQINLLSYDEVADLIVRFLDENLPPEIRVQKTEAGWLRLVVDSGRVRLTYLKFSAEDVYEMLTDIFGFGATDIPTTRKEIADAILKWWVEEGNPRVELKE